MSTFGSYVHGLDEYPHDVWPDNIELLYYAFHLMITLGTIFIFIMASRIFDVGSASSTPIAGCCGCCCWRRTRTFQEEYLAFLKKHGAHFDEKYLWD